MWSGEKKRNVRMEGGGQGGGVGSNVETRFWRRTRIAQHTFYSALRKLFTQGQDLIHSGCCTCAFYDSLRISTQNCLFPLPRPDLRASCRSGHEPRRGGEKASQGGAAARRSEPKASSNRSRPLALVERAGRQAAHILMCGREAFVCGATRMGCVLRRRENQRERRGEPFRLFIF